MWGILASRAAARSLAVSGPPLLKTLLKHKLIFCNTQAGPSWSSGCGWAGGRSGARCGAGLGRQEPSSVQKHQVPAHRSGMRRLPLLRGDGLGMSRVTLQECLELRGPSRLGNVGGAACKDGAVSTGGRAWGWRGAAWVRGPCAVDAPSPGALRPNGFSAAQRQGLFCTAGNCDSFLPFVDPGKG